ncbi:hypothetical protein [Methylomagnum sp.]
MSINDETPDSGIQALGSRPGPPWGIIVVWKALFNEWSRLASGFIEPNYWRFIHNNRFYPAPPAQDR